MGMLTPQARSSETGSLSTGLAGDQREQVIVLLRARGVRRAGVFGSVARGSARPESDLDLLIEPPGDMTLFGFSSLALALEDLTQCPVDLVTYASLHPRLRDSVYAGYDELFDDSDERLSQAERGEDRVR